MLRRVKSIINNLMRIGERVADDKIASSVVAPQTYEIGGWRGILKTGPDGKQYLETNPLKTWHVNMDHLSDFVSRFR